jgi:ribosomal-protein-alanine N-acetyltransferase
VISATLRPMTKADISAVLRLERTLFGDEAWSRAMLAGELAQQPESRYYLVAEEDGVMAGYGGLLAAGAQGDVLTLAVAGHRWGQGTGSALLDALLTEAARRGCTEVFLEVRTDNARAQRLYRRYGFIQIGIRRGYYQPSGTDALVMRKDLGPAAASAGPAGASAGPAGASAGPAVASAGPAGASAGPAGASAGPAARNAAHSRSDASGSQPGGSR